jgi:hypothetical protein
MQCECPQARHAAQGIEELRLSPNSLVCMTSQRAALTDYQPFDLTHRKRLPQCRVGNRCFDQLGKGTWTVCFWHNGTLVSQVSVKNVLWVRRRDNSQHITVLNELEAINRMTQFAMISSSVTYGKQTTSIPMLMWRLDERSAD